MCNAALKLLGLTHGEIPRPRDVATELNNHGMIKLGDVHYQTEPNVSTFSERDLSLSLINDDSSFCSRVLLAIDLQCHVFSFRKAFVKYPSLSVNGIFDDVRYVGLNFLMY